MFIFGRFFSKILNPDVDIFAIDFFATYKLAPYDGVRLGFLSMIFLFSMYMGAVLGRDIKFKLGSSGGVEEGGGAFLSHASHGYLFLGCHYLLDKSVCRIQELCDFVI